MADDRDHSAPGERVMFLSIETGEDLILSFAIAREGDLDGDVVSLILMRSKYEFLLPEEERGVSVSHESWRDTDGELLRRLVWAGDQVDVESTVRRYRLDVSRVDASEVQRGKRLLQRMNEDRRFVLLFS